MHTQVDPPSLESPLRLIDFAPGVADELTSSLTEENQAAVICALCAAFRLIVLVAAEKQYGIKLNKPRVSVMPDNAFVGTNEDGNWIARYEGVALLFDWTDGEPPIKVLRAFLVQ